MAGAWYLALGALCGLPAVYFLVGFASKALIGLGVTLAVAGVGQDTASPLIAGAVLVVAAAGPVPFLFWGGARDQEP